MRERILVPGTMAAVMALMAASPGVADEIPELLRRCVVLDDDARRLACYDRYVSRGGAEAAAEDSATPANPTEPANGEAAAEDRFGFPDVDEEELDEISATITDIVVRRSQERILTLDNGQVWVEDSPRRSVRLEVGDEVEIRSGLFGSYRLFGPANRSTDVDRVR